jgi:3-phenylpropionate/trans-cinnamate dioxygenase ferredoxin subunit
LPWIDAGAANALEEEETLRLDHEGRAFAIFRNHQGDCFRTDGLCPRETVHLAGGLVIENTLEGTGHASVFEFTTGEVETPPACEDLRTGPSRIENGRVRGDI